MEREEDAMPNPSLQIEQLASYEVNGQPEADQQVDSHPRSWALDFIKTLNWRLTSDGSCCAEARQSKDETKPNVEHLTLDLFGGHDHDQEAPNDYNNAKMESATANTVCCPKVGCGRKSKKQDKTQT